MVVAKMRLKDEKKVRSWLFASAHTLLSKKGEALRGFISQALPVLTEKTTLRHWPQIVYTT